MRVGLRDAAAPLVAFAAILTVVAMAFAAGCTARGAAPAQAAATCGPLHAGVSAARELSTEMTLGRIIDLLGEPDADVGSGVHVLQWSCSDGSLIRVSAVSLDRNAKPMAVNASP